MSRSHSVCRNILESVALIQIFITQGTPVSFAKYSGNTDTCLSMLDPETFWSPHPGWIRVSPSFTLSCEKKCRVKVNPTWCLPLQTLPTLLKCFGSSLSRSTNSPGSKDRIACMQIQLLLPGHQTHCLVHVCHQLFGCLCLSGIVSGCLDSTGQRTVMVEAGYIISLPAVQCIQVLLPVSSISCFYIYSAAKHTFLLRTQILSFLFPLAFFLILYNCSFSDIADY